MTTAPKFMKATLMSDQSTSSLTTGPDFSRQFLGFDRLTQPRVVVDEPTLLRNIKNMATLIGSDAELHPHIKTHKSLEIARLQKQFGARGFTAARPYEAAMLLKDGLAPVTVAYPLLCRETIASLLKEAGSSDDIRFIADSRETIEALCDGARRTGRKAQVFLKVDVGLHRCGIDPTGSIGLELAASIDRHPDLIFSGLLSHAGHAYGAGDVQRIAAIAADELAIMTGLRGTLEKNGISVPCVSVGSTPTILRNAGFVGVDEARPGNYVFYDLTAVRLGLVDRTDLALGVAAQVVAVNDHFAIANVGSKTLSSDLGAHGTSATKSFGEAWTLDAALPLAVAKLSEEHAFLTYDDIRPAVGTPVLILPNHSCPVANLSGGLHILGKDGEPARYVATEGFVNSR